MAKSKKRIQAKKAEASKTKNLDIQSGLFFISGAKKIFTKLKQAFIKASILNYFDLEHYIQIETDISNYVIDGIYNQLTSADLRQWHLIAFFS